MNTIDLIVCLVLALAVWNGWRKGFIVQAGSLVALVVGLWLALRFGKPVGEWLHFDPWCALRADSSCCCWGVSCWSPSSAGC